MHGRRWVAGHPVWHWAERWTAKRASTRAGTRTWTWALAAAQALVLTLGVHGAAQAQLGSTVVSGATPAEIQPYVDFLRVEIGRNNGTGGAFLTGRREITWDDVPDAFASPAALPKDFFNTTMPRGVVFDAGISVLNVSRDADSGGPAQVRFGNIDPVFAALSQTYSPERLFTSLNGNVIDVTFRVPGTNTPATVKDFGIIFVGVDKANLTSIEVFDDGGISQATFFAKPGALSFISVNVNPAFWSISRIRIRAGTSTFGNEGPNKDVVVIDDVIVSEPQPPRFEFEFFALRAALEGDLDSYSLAVQRTGFISQAASVSIALSGTATAGSDYQALPLTIDFAPNERVGFARVEILDDALAEGLEVAHFTLTNPTNGHGVGVFGRTSVLILDSEVPPPSAYAATTENRLVRFSIDDTRTFTADLPIEGLAANDTIVGLDYRPADKRLYAVGASSRLYRLTISTTSATAVPIGDPFGPPLTPQYVGADFDPVLDQLRVVAPDGINVRLDPTTGRVVGGAADTPPAYVPGDHHEGKTPELIALGYTNSVPGAASTTAYALDAKTGAFVRFDSATAGTLRTVGDYDLVDLIGGNLDVDPATNFAFAIAAPTMGLLPTEPYALFIDLETGRFGILSRSPLEVLRAALTPAPQVTASALIPSSSPDQNPLPELRIGDVTIAEGDRGTTNAVLTLSLSSPAAAGVTVSFATAGGTAAADSDYVSASGVATFAAGATTQTIGVPVIGDVFVEGPHAFVVNLSAPANAMLVDSQAVVTIQDDDTQVTYALAEGATGPFFDTDILIANPYATAAPVTLTFLKEDATTVTQDLTLAPTSRTTVRADEIAGLESAAFSTVVTSTSGLPLVVERTMRWDGAGYGAHTEKAVDGSALTWYFAEGSQGFFSTYLLLANPNAEETTATVVYLREGDTPVTRTYTIAPRARFTVDTGDEEALRDRSFGMNVTFSAPGVAERAMYFGASPLWKAGHGSAGVTAPATQWFLAEGATGGFFETFVLLSNPQSTPAEVTLTYLIAGAAPVTRTKTVPASGRLTVNIEGEDEALADAAVATQVVSSAPIIVERAQYWPFTPDQWYEAHNSFGVDALGVSWGLAEGRTGGPQNYQTYILLANPGAVAADVTIVFLRSDGTTVTKVFTVPAASRFNVATGAGGPVPELVDEEFGVVISSTQPIAVERAMYLDAGGLVWSAGTNATATRLP